MTVPEDSESIPDFDGKVVAFYCGINSDFAISIMSPSFVQQAGRLFVSGKAAPRATKRWYDELQSAVAWDDVSSYTVFQSLEEYQQRMCVPDREDSRLDGWLSRLLGR